LQPTADSSGGVGKDEDHRVGPGCPPHIGEIGEEIQAQNAIYFSDIRSAADAHLQVWNLVTLDPEVA
jgi:hypothetical protein